MLLKQAIQSFIKYMRQMERSNQTITGYEKELSYLNNFLDVRHNCPVYLADVGLEDLEAYLLSQKKRGISSASRSRSTYIIRSFYNYCMKKDLCPKNIAMLLEPIKINQKERTFITQKEFEALVKAIKQPVVKVIVQTMFYTGGRISEMIHLKIEDVDIKNRMLHIIEGKGKKNRDVPINDKLLTILKRYLKKTRAADSDRFFAIERTGKISGSYVNRIIKEAAHEIGLEKEVSAHVLRHSFGTNLLEKGVSVVSIQKLLGHANLSVTSRYLHQDMEKLTSAVNLL